MNSASLVTLHSTRRISVQRFRSILLIAVCVSVGSTLHADVLAKRELLWNRCHAKLSSSPPANHAGRYFLPGAQFQSDDASTQKLATAYADKLIDLAKSSASDNPSAAYRLLHEAAYFGEDNIADKIVNSKKTVEPKAKLATHPHPRLKWRRREYFRVTSEHYQVVTRDEQAGVDIARRLETLYAVWRQVFLECWSDSTKLESAMERGKTLVPHSRQLHRVVLFSNQQEYTAYLQKTQPRIGITKGFYDPLARTSYFFAGEQSNHATQLHEATHQLFQEVQSASERLKMSQNFWIIEGIAMYMESLQHHGQTATIGGYGANRLQFARYRRLQEDFYIPLQELVEYGRTQLQQDSQIRQIYSQSAGLTHFLMDGEGAKYRDGLIRYLRTIYAGRDRIDTLTESLDTGLAELDQQYIRYLHVTDDDMASSAMPKDRLRSLCLGHTSVSNAGLRSLPSQNKLEWLDLAGLRIERTSLSFLDSATSLRQVSFDQCSNIGDDTVQLLAKNPQLDELDLSGTAVTDQGLKHLAGHQALATLWLDGTKISDASVPVLATMTSLRTLSCNRTMLSEKGLENLRKKLPGLEVSE